MATGEYENGGVLRFRVEQNSKRIDKHDDFLRTLDRTITQHGERIDDLEETFKRIEQKLDAVQARSTTILVALLSGCVGLSLTILAGTGKI